MERMAFRGGIYIINLGKREKSIQSGLRPCVVVSNDINNIYSPIINIVPLTSSHKNDLPVHYSLDCEKYDFLWKENNIVMAEQVTTVNKSDIERFLGRVEEVDMKKIEECLQIQLAMQK